MLFKHKWFAPILIVLLLSACSSNEIKTLELSPEDEQPVAAKAGPYTVIDDRGVELTFDEVPETVISLQPSNTEILFSLGVGDKIIGATDFDTYPEEALEIERVSDSVKVNGERVIALNPDIIIAYTVGDEAQITQLEDAGLKVFVIESAKTFEDVYSDIKQIAQVMGVVETGDQLVSEIQAQITAVKEKTDTLEEKKQAYFEISPKPDIWTAGSGTFQQEILEAAGVENVFANQQGWFNVAEEEIIKIDPQVILSTVYYTENAVEEILNRSGWDVMQAVMDKEVYLLDGDLIGRPASRIGDAVESVAETVYPELFK